MKRVRKGNKRKSLSKEGTPVDLTQWQVPPVRDWDKFERLCSDLWKKIWEDPNAQRIGRSGQRQYGVDIFGTICGSKKLGGIQCKKKEATADDVIDKKGLQANVEEAKAFQPALSEFGIAYTGKRDAKLQQEARRITEKHFSEGLFAVHVYSWDDILEMLGSYPDVLKKHFPHLAGHNIDTRELNKRIANVESKLETAPNAIADVVLPSFEKIAKEVAQSVIDSSVIAGEHNAEVDHARDLLESFKPKEALDYLEKLEKRIWNGADNILKFRIVTNKAASLSSLGREKEAGINFIQALQFNPDDEKALCNRALGHLLLKQIPDAKEFAQKVIKKNPASVHAYGILIHCFSETESLEEIIQKIPSEVRKTEDVAYAIAHTARQRGDFDSAVQWLEIALKDSQDRGKKNIDLHANLALTILEPIMAKYEVASGIQLTPEDKAKILKAIDLLTDAIDDVTALGSIKNRASWLAHRSTAYNLLGQFSRALGDIEAAARLQPEDPAIIKQQAFMLHISGDHLAPIDILRKVLGKPEVPEAALILAGILYEDGKGDEAKKILEESLTKDLPAALQTEMQRLLIQIYLRESKFDRVRDISGAMRVADPTNVLNLVTAARIERVEGKIDAAAKLLDEARGYLTDKTPSLHVIELADELFTLEKYPDAWPLYERIADPRVNTPLLKNLLYSYYRAGEVEKALDICKLIPPENKTQSLIQIELAILQDIDDLKTAATKAESYLESHPDDFQIRIHLATIWFRTNELDKLDAFLKKDVDLSKLSIDAGFLLAQILSERDMLEKSLHTAYELRRANFNNGEAHLKYIGIFFKGDHKLEDFLTAPKELHPGGAICIKNDVGELTWYVLEDRRDLDAAMNELDLTSELGKKLLGKKLGEEVVIFQGSLSETKVTVAELKNKYVRALHESLRLLPERFVETKGLERVTFKSGTEEETRESIQKILDVVSKRDEKFIQAEKFYHESKLTLGALASLIGRNAIDVWNGLVGSKWCVKTCIGSLEERQEALALLANSKVVAIDITGLLTAERVGLLPVLEKRFDKILIAQSTLDELQGAISEKKGMESRGYLTISKEEGQFIRQEITSENVKKQIEYLEGVKDWARKHCEVTPCITASKIPQHDELDKLIGRPFLETILIAKENDCPLYTDDFGTKSLAFSNEFKVSGVWTQAIAICALSDKQITEEEYNKIVIQLINLKYRHTTINGSVILTAAKEAHWSNVQPFTGVLDTLRGSQTEIRSAVTVLVDFILLLWYQPILDFQRDTLIMAALDVLTDQRNDRMVIRLVRRELRYKFRLLPLAEVRVQQIISAWENLRIKPFIKP